MLKVSKTTKQLDNQIMPETINRSKTSNDMSAREAQLTLANMILKTMMDSHSGMGYLVMAAISQANSTIASVMKSQFPGTSVEPSRLPHLQSENSLGNEAGMGSSLGHGGSGAGVEEHPVVDQSVQHDGVSVDNTRENAHIPENEQTLEKLDTIPAHQLTAELQNKLTNEKKLQKEYSSAPILTR